MACETLKHFLFGHQAVDLSRPPNRRTAHLNLCLLGVACDDSDDQEEAAADVPEEDTKDVNTEDSCNVEEAQNGANTDEVSELGEKLGEVNVNEEEEEVLDMDKFLEKQKEVILSLKEPKKGVEVVSGLNQDHEKLGWVGLCW